MNLDKLANAEIFMRNVDTLANADIHRIKFDGLATNFPDIATSQGVIEGLDPSHIASLNKGGG